MNSEVTILYHDELDPLELNVMNIISFLGGTIKLVQSLKESLPHEHEDSLSGVVSNDGCLITNAQTLVEEKNQMDSGLDMHRILMSTASNVLVYGFKPTPCHSQILQELTLGTFSGVESLHPGDTEFRVEQDSRKICRQFAGLNFGSADSDKNFTFTEGTSQIQYSTLIRIGHKPFFVCIKDKEGQMMLLATQKIADLNAKVSADTSILQYFSELVPLMMFLFSASPNGFWHNDMPKACFIVDDPLLKRQYGFLDYRKLLKLMESCQFCTSIAFIPWNYRRSDRKITKLFKIYPRRYSLCIHGCDHTKEEFGNTCLVALRNKAQKALDRMIVHQRFSELPFDKVMVFPQGIFSTVAMKALKSCGYLAAVNSTPYPFNVEDKTLMLRELLDVAVTRFSNFPLFVRRYPRNLAELAFDLFLGKPILLVEHHGYFRNGYGALTEFVDKINAFDERLIWTSLETICSQACLVRVAEDGVVHVRFYADTFCLQNDADHSRTHILFRRQEPERSVICVTVNGKGTDFDQESDWLVIPLKLGALMGAKIEIEHREPKPVAITSPRLIHDTKVFVRRVLSEFRDNYMEKNALLSGMVFGVRNLLFRRKRRSSRALMRDGLK